MGIPLVEMQKMHKKCKKQEEIGISARDMTVDKFSL